LAATSSAARCSKVSFSEKGGSLGFLLMTKPSLTSRPSPL
jgi:hypothetical protein